MDLTSAHDLHDWLDSTQSKRWPQAQIGQQQAVISDMETSEYGNIRPVQGSSSYIW